MAETRNTKKYHEWKRNVLKRDKNECKHCYTDKKLIAHHIVPWKENVELRYEVVNGLTLCIACHMRLHKNHKGKTQIAWNKGLKTGISPWKGKQFSEEHKKKLSLAKKGKPSWNKGIVGEKSHMTGKKMSHKGKHWKIDPENGKRIWFENKQGGQK